MAREGERNRQARGRETRGREMRGLETRDREARSRETVREPAGAAPRRRKRKSANYLKQGGILAAASILVRIIGLLYRIPVTRIIGDDGNNFYSAAFEVYTIMLLISSYSIPLAVAKQMSARNALGEYRNAHRVFRGALFFSFLVGLVLSAVTFLGAGFFTSILRTPESTFALRILAPAILILSVMGVFRGFFQGQNTMMPTAASQLAEQVINAIVSIGAAYLFVNMGTEIDAILGTTTASHAYGAGGSTLGTTAGALAALLFLLFVYGATRGGYMRRMRKDKSRHRESSSEILRVLVLTIIPVILSTAIYNVSGILDQIVYKALTPGLGMSPEDISASWGIFTGKFKTLTNVPIAIANALVSSTVPVLAMYMAERNYKETRRKIQTSTRFTMILAFPCAVGIGVLASPILYLLYGDTNPLSAGMLYAGAVSIVLYSLSTLSNGILQGINRMRTPVTHAAVALVLHLAALYVMLAKFDLGIYAVIHANSLFALLMCLLNGFAIRRYIGFRQEFVRTFLIPLICSAVMGGVVYGLYFVLDLLLPFADASVLARTVATGLKLFPVIGIGAFVYFVLLLLLRGVTRKELLEFPKGATLLRVARRLRLM